MASDEEAVVKEGDMVEINFKGSLLDGKVFEDTVTGGKTIKFKAGEQTVMPALDRAVIGMKVGDDRRVVCEPSEAFGEIEEEYIMEIPMERAPEGLKLGGHVHLMGNMTARCTAINEEAGEFVLDMNHELAGKTVVMEISLIALDDRDPEKRFPLKKSEEEWKEQLEEFEYHVIRDKGTEPGGTGEYDKFYPEQGHFTCRACDAPLYSAQSKFDSGCGWPAFDKCFKDSVAIEVDGTMGMRRVEIMCNNCGGHLGHVFENEDMTETNERHCVNSVSVKFVDEAVPEGLEEAKVV